MTNFTRQDRFSRLLFLPAAVFLSLMPLVAPAEPQPDVQAIVHETQQLSRDADKMVFVWWMPEQFWKASLQERALSEQKTEKFMSVVRRYTTIAVVDGRLGAVGGLTYSNEEEMRSTVSVKDLKGRIHRPIDVLDADPDMRNLVAVMKPILGNMLGPLGTNMHFFLFQTDDRQQVVDATSEGTLEIHAADATFKYRLPLGSVLSPRYDTKTGEQFPGNYSFSPYMGNKLTSVPPAPAGASQ